MATSRVGHASQKISFIQNGALDLATLSVEELSSLRMGAFCRNEISALAWCHDDLDPLVRTRQAESAARLLAKTPVPCDSKGFITADPDECTLDQLRSGCFYNDDGGPWDSAHFGNLMCRIFSVLTMALAKEGTIRAPIPSQTSLDLLADRLSLADLMRCTQENRSVILALFDHQEDVIEWDFLEKLQQIIPSWMEKTKLSQLLISREVFQAMSQKQLNLILQKADLPIWQQVGNGVLAAVEAETIETLEIGFTRLIESGSLTLPCDVVRAIERSAHPKKEHQEFCETRDVLLLKVWNDIAAARDGKTGTSVEEISSLKTMLSKMMQLSPVPQNWIECVQEQPVWSRLELWENIVLFQELHPTSQTRAEKHIVSGLLALKEQIKTWNLVAGMKQESLSKVDAYIARVRKTYMA